MNSCFVSGTLLNTLLILTHLIPATNHIGKYYYCSFLTEEETEAQKGEVTHLRSHSQGVAEQAAKCCLALGQARDGSKL